MRKLFFTISCCSCFVLAAAQDPRYEYQDTSLLNETTINGAAETGNENDEDTADILSDTTLYISEITISKDSILKWKNDRRFAYVNYLDSLLKLREPRTISVVSSPQKPSLLQRLLSSGIVKALFWIFAIAFVLYILSKLFLSEGLFKRSDKRSAVTLLPEDIQPGTVEDYDKMLHQSILAGDHRAAVRYLFLKTLRLLADKDLIQQAADKTNYEYMQEINPERRNEFASLVLSYEYAWYGNFPVDQQSYYAIEKKFTTFNNKI